MVRLRWVTSSSGPSHETSLPVPPSAAVLSTSLELCVFCATTLATESVSPVQ